MYSAVWPWCVGFVVQSSLTMGVPFWSRTETDLKFRTQITHYVLENCRSTLASLILLESTSEELVYFCSTIMISKLK